METILAVLVVRLMTAKVIKKEISVSWDLFIHIYFLKSKFFKFICFYQFRSETVQFLIDQYIL